MGMGDAAGGVGCLRRCIGTKKLRGLFRHEYKYQRSAKGRYVVSWNLNLLLHSEQLLTSRNHHVNFPDLWESINEMKRKNRQFETLILQEQQGTTRNWRHRPNFMGHEALQLPPRRRSAARGLVNLHMVKYENSLHINPQCSGGGGSGGIRSASTIYGGTQQWFAHFEWENKCSLYRCLWARNVRSIIV